MEIKKKLQILKYCHYNKNSRNKYGLFKYPEHNKNRYKV